MKRLIFHTSFISFLKTLFLISIFSVHFSGYSQSKKIDLLKISLAKSKIDTAKINILNCIAMETRNSSIDTSLSYANKALLLSKKNGYLIGEVESNLWICVANFNSGKNDTALLICNEALKISLITLKKGTNELFRLEKLIARLYNMLGNIHKHYGNYDLSLKKFEECLKIRTSINDKEGMAVTLSNIALIYSLKGNYLEALKKNFESLKISQSDKNNDGISQASAYNAIGKIYLEEGNNEQALYYLLKSLEISKKINAQGNIASNLIPIGELYVKKNNYTTALYYFSKALNIGKTMKLKNIQTMSLLNIAKVNFIQKNLGEALIYAKQSLSVANESKNIFMISENLNFIGTILLENGSVKEAIIHCEKSLELAKSLKSMTLINSSSLSLANCYKKIGDDEKVYEMQKLHDASSDSISAQKNKQEILKQELKYKYEKQTLADSINYNNQKKHTEIVNQVKLQTEKNKQIYLIIGLALVILFSAFLYKRFKITKQQNLIIERQNINLVAMHNKLEITHRELEQKSKEIKDSILYSKEIQNTFLKSPSNSKNYLKDTFLFYKPKDVVSGDFYWYKEIGDDFFVVIGDCTGHGVPGAIISVLAIQSLEKTINKIKNHEQLHELNSLIKNEFNVYYKVDGHVSIGLDFSVICINKKQDKLYLSGSGSTILIINNDDTLTTHKFDTINIGGKPPTIYEPNTIGYDLKSIQSIFLYTDGIIDQKGFETGKKFGSKQLKKLLLNLKTNDSTIALEKIEKEITSWMGTIDQVDDMTLLGIQIKQS